MPRPHHWQVKNEEEENGQVSVVQEANIAWAWSDHVAQLTVTETLKRPIQGHMLLC